ncbi:twin-arginine translocase TatA/TatE family subunit [Streptomyces sp. NPDC002911]
MFGISEIAIFIVLAVLVFGARKLPELARSLGKSARILKSEARALKTDGVSPADPADPRVIKGTATARTEQH